MPKDIVVIGASAGGIEALRVLVGRLPADFPGSLFVVLHTSPEAMGVGASALLLAAHGVFDLMIRARARRSVMRTFGTLIVMAISA